MVQPPEAAAGPLLADSPSPAPRRSLFSRSPAGDRTLTNASIVGTFAALSAVYAIAMVVFCGGKSFPLDDAFIHLQFARHLLEEGQMAFNAGVPSSGSTAPGFTALLALVRTVTGDWYMANYALGAICALAGSLLSAAILRDWTGREEIARFGGILIVVMHPTVMQAYSGMEVSLYTALFMAGLYLYGRGGMRGRLAASAVFALSIWTRPEMMLMGPMAALERFVAARMAKRPVSSIAGEVAGHASIFGAMLGVYGAYHWRLDRHLVPSTFSAKATARYAGQLPAFFEGLPSAVAHQNWGHALLGLTAWPAVVVLSTVIGLFLGCIPLSFSLRSRVRAALQAARPDGADAARRLAVLVLVGYPAARGVVDVVGIFGFQFQRYYGHLTPVAVLLCVEAVFAAETAARLRRRKGLWLAAALVGSLGWGVTAVGGASNIRELQVAMGEWVEKSTPPDALIATNDIGAIAFSSQRRILDLIGLVEPGLVRHLLAGGDVAGYVAERRPDYLIVYPAWFPEIVNGGAYERVFSTKITHNFVCGGHEFVAYRRVAH